MNIKAYPYLLVSSFFVSQAHSFDQQQIQHYQSIAQQKQLQQHPTWQKLLYISVDTTNSKVAFDHFFLSQQGRSKPKVELDANIAALLTPNTTEQAYQCRFPARSQWLIQNLGIEHEDLPKVNCVAFDAWFNTIQPHQITLIFATDFMGNPSSMFGHTLLRIDPKDSSDKNLVSYAINYAATPNSQDNWSYAWKGLTGKYPGEYSIMPYYRKVKEYGDMESRDLWEYELNLSDQQAKFLVLHMWELQGVSFPYYFSYDNCAYALLGLLDLVDPDWSMQSAFNLSTIPIEMIKVVEKAGLIKNKIYRPSLKTQLLSQERQYGRKLSEHAHQIALAPINATPAMLQKLPELEQARSLEVAYDDLYLHFLGQNIASDIARPKLRSLLDLRSQIDLPKQRLEAPRPRIDPSQGHHAQNIVLSTGQVQGDSFINLSLRKAYHDLIDPQAGYRMGTQLIFLQGDIQYRQDKLKLDRLNLLSINSYNPRSSFDTPLSWGFNLGWQQEAVHEGTFSETMQHGVLNLQGQLGYSSIDLSDHHLCYAQMQVLAQFGQSIEQGWRMGAGPTVGCINQWTQQQHSVIQLELPYWEEQKEWNPRLNVQWQYTIQSNHSLRLGWHFEQQGQNWDKLTVGYAHYF